MYTMGKSIVCPRCGYYLKLNTEICKHCGFSFKDAFEKAENRDAQLKKVIEEFDNALRMGDKLKAYVCLGKLELLHDPKFHLRSGIVLSRDAEYELAYNEFLLYKHGNNENLKSHDLTFTSEEIEALPYELENYARSGQLFMFNVVNGGSGEVALDMYHRLYLNQIAFDNAPLWELKNYFELKEIEDDKGYVRVIKNYKKDSPEYHTLFLQHLCEDMVNLVMFKKDVEFAQKRTSEVGENLISEENDYVILQTKKYAQLLVSIPIRSESGEDPINRIFQANSDEIDSKEFNEWLDDIISAILFGETTNPLPNEPTNYFTYFKCLEKLKNMELYCKRVNRYLKVLLSFESEHSDEVRHIAGTAFYERTAKGLPVNELLEGYIQRNLNSVQAEEEEEKNRRIYSILSAKGRSAMEVADWEYENSQAEEYGWRDAGPLSLSYFRILELELNQKLILPLLKKVEIKNIKECFRRDKENLSENKGKKFIKDWEKHIQQLETILNPKVDKDGLELGWLNFFLESIKRLDDEQALSKLISTSLYSSSEESILTEEGFNALNSGTLQDTFSDEKCNRYRNPPAHTRYLPYRVAEECREYVRDTVVKFGRWFNVG